MERRFRSFTKKEREDCASKGMSLHFRFAGSVAPWVPTVDDEADWTRRPLPGGKKGQEREDLAVVVCEETGHGVSVA